MLRCFGTIISFALHARQGKSSRLEAPPSLSYTSLLPNDLLTTISRAISTTSLFHLYTAYSNQHTKRDQLQDLIHGGGRPCRRCSGSTAHSGQIRERDEAAKDTYDCTLHRKIINDARLQRLLASFNPFEPHLLQAVTTEFLTANISMPFLLFMVANFKDIGSPDPGAASGILVSLLFVSQFFTSLLWASLADKFGARPILSISMLGAAFSTMAFGFCTTLRAAIIVRLIHGGFLGAVGVGRATVSVVANPSNEARAYSIVAFCWSMGGVLAAILGGSLESPTVHFPWLRAFVVLEVYPYCLPCIAAALLPLFGGLLALTLANDGGPRQGRLQLAGSEAPLVSEVDVRATLHPPDTIANRRPSLSPQTSLRAYPTFRGRVSSVTSMVAQARKGSIAATLYGPANDERAPELQDMSELNLAQKLLMANEGLPSLSNLWFQAAIAADNEEVFENDLSNENSQAVDDGELSVDPFPLQSSTQGHIDQRRYSSTSQRRGSIFRREDQHADQEVQLPTIFQNSGLEAPAALIVDLPADVAPSATTAALVSDPGLQTVTEGEALEIEPEPEVPVAAKPSSVFTLLPKQIIAQFALLALHTTVHDQVFYLYLG